MCSASYIAICVLVCITTALQESSYFKMGFKLHAYLSKNYYSKHFYLFNHHLQILPLIPNFSVSIFAILTTCFCQLVSCRALYWSQSSSAYNNDLSSVCGKADILMYADVTDISKNVTFVHPPDSMNVLSKTHSNLCFKPKYLVAS